MLKAMARSAMNTRSERNEKALVWTVKSLSDDVGLEPFVEAIPDVLWGPFRRRHGCEVHILHLAHHPETHIHNRSVTLLDSCESGLLSLKDGERRRIICYKALWTIGSLAKPTYHSEPSPFSANLVRTYRPSGRPKEFASAMAPAIIFSSARWAAPCFLGLWEDLSNAGGAPIDFTRIHPTFKLPESNPAALYALSASSMMQWSRFCAMRAHLLGIRNHLQTCSEKIERRLDHGHFSYS
jgi:hypothetical protein